MSNLIEMIRKEIKQEQITYEDKTKIVLRHNDLELAVYDADNLVGFTLTGAVDGGNVYIVHDTDNYRRDNPRYQHLYESAISDAQFVANLLLQDKLEVHTTLKKGLLGLYRKKKVLITIPNDRGESLTYESPLVNTTDFQHADRFEDSV